MSFEVKKNSSVAIRFKRVLMVGMIVGCIAGIVVTLLITGIVTLIKGIQNKKTESKPTTTVEQQIKEESVNSESTAEEDLKADKTLHEQMNDPAGLLGSDQNDWEIALVNYNHPLPKDYVPELKELFDGKYVDSRIYDDAMAMLDAAEEAGVSINLCSAYRSYDDQKEVFQTTMNQWMIDGYETMDAFYEANNSVALPGQSEHATGLALDITSAEYTELDEQQASTDTAKWLAAHCAEYGFILRYPPQKSDITKIIYEPWHYRYVGKDLAKEITESGITLEEYWEQRFK